MNLVHFLFSVSAGAVLHLTPPLPGVESCERRAQPVAVPAFPSRAMEPVGHVFA
jgi:hypothetical protein